MLFVNENLNINIENKKNYRAFCKHLNKYYLTIFPNKSIFVLDENFKIISNIKTNDFYGDIFPLSSDLFLCCCYSSLKTQIHIINKNGEIIEKIDYYKLMKKEDINKEKFISFCQNCFEINSKIFFYLKSSNYIYKINIKNQKLSKINLNDILITPFSLLCCTQYQNFIYCIIKQNYTYKLLKFNIKKDIFEIHKIKIDNLNIENEIYNLKIYNNELFITIASIKESKVLKLYTDVI